MLGVPAELSALLLLFARPLTSCAARREEPRREYAKSAPIVAHPRTLQIGGVAPTILVRPGRIVMYNPQCASKLRRG